jgi:hypothetical protein
MKSILIDCCSTEVKIGLFFSAISIRSVLSLEDISDDEIKLLVEKSYDLVAKSVGKRNQ